MFEIIQRQIIIISSLYSLSHLYTSLFYNQSISFLCFLISIFMSVVNLFLEEEKKDLILVSLNNSIFAVKEKSNGKHQNLQAFFRHNK